MSSTSFAQWRDDLGYSISEAASALGLSVAQIAILIRGRDGKGRLTLPRPDTLLLMEAARRGIALAPFPLRPDELEAQREARRRTKESLRAKAAGRAPLKKAA